MGDTALTVADLVEAAVARDPSAQAVVAGPASLTYAQLEGRASRLAHHLQGLGVGPDALVGVALGRSLDLAVALVAVLKAGGACVPLDPDYPVERLAFMIDDAELTALVTTTGIAERVPMWSVPRILVDHHRDLWEDEPAATPARTTTAEHLGYVIYTSGSTGRPKGVMLTHRGLVNHHRAAVNLYGLGPGDRVLQFCSLGFDASIEEMFPTWAAGATVVFRPDDAPLLGPSWDEWLARQRITILNLPTAYWHEWVRDLDARGASVPADIRLVVVGGEKARGPAYRAWRRITGARPRWVNVYGPCETTCMSTFYEPPAHGDDIGDGRDPPIGQPLPNTTVRVVDDDLAPVGTGVVGELLIGGAGLARGYLNQPRLTAERFVEDDLGERMYRTGDLVRRLNSGDLDFVGRIDDQVKIRGFRIEVREVEAALARHRAVGAVAVVARDDDQTGDKRLVAYVAGSGAEAPDADELRRFAGERLPAYMVPAAFVTVDALPLTPNGKVDREALPAPPAAGPAGGPSPRSATERRIAAIWARVLGLDPSSVGVHDDFFALGGHSLLATQVIAQVREEFGTETPLRAIFEAPTVAGLAAGVEAEGGAVPEAPVLARRAPDPDARLPLSLAQEQMWRLEAAASPLGLYNITVFHRFGAPVDETALAAALAYLVERHEVFRTRFGVEPDGTPYQQVMPAANIALGIEDLRVSSDEERQRRIAEHDARPFDPAEPPLLRATLFREPAESSRLALTIDHLISDGNSIAVLMGELLAAYSSLTQGRAPALPPLPLQFADFAVWQRAHVTEAVLREQLGWWSRALDRMPLGPALPFDHMPAVPTRRIASRAFVVDAATRSAVEDLARDTGSTVFVVTAAATLALLGHRGGTSDVVVSTTLNGRSRAEVEGLVGMFSGVGRVRADLSGDPPFRAIVERTRDFVLGMFEHQDIPFMRVRRAVCPDFPTEGLALAAALPIELQYFRVGAVEPEFYFRGQLHPLSITLLDDGTEISGEMSYKLDFYDEATIARLSTDLPRVLAAVGADPSLRLSDLPLSD